MFGGRRHCYKPAMLWNLGEGCIELLRSHRTEVFAEEQILADEADTLRDLLAGLRTPARPTTGKDFRDRDL